jgi:hypothetical protein
MNDIGNVILIILMLFFVYYVLKIFTSTILLYNDSNAEHFIGKYYKWNWNDPNMMSLINTVNGTQPCKNCTYRRQ